MPAPRRDTAPDTAGATRHHHRFFRLSRDHRSGLVELKFRPFRYPLRQHRYRPRSISYVPGNARRFIRGYRYARRLLGGFGIIIGAIATGGDVMIFRMFRRPDRGRWHLHGDADAGLAGRFLGSFAIGLKAFLYKVDDPKKLIEEAVALADIARKNGLLALEGQEISNEFMKKGIGLCVDGHDPALVQKMLTTDIDLTIQRHEVGQRMFRTWRPWRRRWA